MGNLIPPNTKIIKSFKLIKNKRRVRNKSIANNFEFREELLGNSQICEVNRSFAKESEQGKEGNIDNRNITSVILDHQVG